MENQQKINRIKDMIRQYEYEKFDADLRLGVNLAMGRNENNDHLIERSAEAEKALVYLNEELAKYAEPKEEEVVEEVA